MVLCFCCFVSSRSALSFSPRDVSERCLLINILVNERFHIQTLKFNRPRSPLLPCAASLKEEDGGARKRRRRGLLLLVQRAVKIQMTEKLKELKENEIKYVYLAHADLHGKDLQNADLRESKLQSADLRCVRLQQANLACVRVNSDISLNRADLRLANFYLSYLDETKTLRNAIVGKYDVNEIISDLTGRKNMFF